MTPILAAWTLTFACLLLSCKSETRKESPVDGARTKGAAVMSSGVSIKKLGEVSPGIRWKWFNSRKRIDPAPIVLWNGTTPATVLYFQSESDSSARWMKQVIARVDGKKEGGYPIELEAQLAKGASDHDPMNLVDTTGIITADVNGDGVEELLMMRNLGGADVHGVNGPLFDYPSPLAGPDAYYKPYVSHQVRLKGRDVVFLLYERVPSEGGEPNLLLRIDSSGINKVQLRDLGNRKIVAVGALQYPMSEAIDELLICLEDEEETFLARYRSDGTLIAPPRKLYVERPRGAAFEFVPNSDRAVLGGVDTVLIVSPAKTTNWIQTIDLAERAESGDLQLFETVDVATDPKVLFRSNEELWAVNGKGTCFKPAGKGWSAMAKPGPFQQLTPAPGLRRTASISAGQGRILVLFERKSGTRPMTHEEWQRAADRFLPPVDAAKLREKLTPSLETVDFYRDTLIKDERAERKAPEVHTVEEWKKILPDSYAAIAASNLRAYDIDVEFRFKTLKENPDRAKSSPDPDGLRAFLSDLEVGARIEVTLFDGASRSSIDFPGVITTVESFMTGLLEIRLRDGRFGAVMALEGVDPSEKDGPAFYLVEAPLGGER